MNQDRLDKLTERASRATELAGQIVALQKASPKTGGTRLSFEDYSSSKDILQEDLLKDVVEAGRLAVLAAKEAELESLIATEPETLPIGTKESEVA